MKEPMSNDKKNKLILLSFLISLSIVHILFWISLTITKGYSFNSIIYSYFSSSVMDFFQPLVAATHNAPYDFFEGEFNITATPFALLILKFFSGLIKGDVFNYNTSFFIHFTESMIVYMMFLLFTVTAVSLIVFSLKKGNNAIKAWFIFLLIFSTPFIYIYEQGSTVILAVIFTYLYVLGYDNDSKIIRQLSLIALAIATGLKVFPILFIILTFRKKRIGEGFLAFVYSAIFFFVPAFFFEGLGTLQSYLNNIGTAIEGYTTVLGTAYRVDIFSGLDTISLCLGNGIMTYGVLKIIIWAVLVISLLICAFISKSAWRRVLAITLLVTSAPVFSNYSSLAFMVIPLTMFLDTDEKREGADFLYEILFIIMLAPIAIKDCIVDFELNPGNELYIYSFLCTCAVTIMIFVLSIETLGAPLAGIELSKKKREMMKNNQANQED